MDGCSIYLWYCRYVSNEFCADANDIVNNGIDIGNWINTVFDVATNAAQGVSLNAYNLASRALRKVLKTTAKAKAKKDALSRVAFVGNQAVTSAYKKAAQAAKNANFVPSSKPLNIFAQSPRTDEIGVLGKYTTIEQAAKNNMIGGRLVDNFIKKDIAEDAARKAVNKAGQAVSAYSEALRWRPFCCI